MAEDFTPKAGGESFGPHSYFQNFQHTPVGARVPEKVGRGVFSTAVMVLQSNEFFLLDFLSMMVPPQQVVARVVMTASSFSQFLAALRVNISNYEGQFGPLSARLIHGAPRTPPAGQLAGPAAPLAPMASTASMASAGPGASPESMAPAPPAPIMLPDGGKLPMPTGHGSAHLDSGPPTAITDLYEQLKFPEELYGGVFANAVMIRHTPEEFSFDFIANFFPRPCVVARVFTAAGRVPSLMDAMSNSLQRFQHGGGPPPPPPA